MREQDLRKKVPGRPQNEGISPEIRREHKGRRNKVRLGEV